MRAGALFDLLYNIELGIDGDFVYLNFIVEMRTGRSTHRVDFGDDITSFYVLADFQQIHAIVDEFRNNALYVPNCNNSHMPALSAGQNDNTIRRDEYRRSFSRDNINALMKFSLIRKWGAPVSKTGGEPPFDGPYGGRVREQYVFVSKGSQ